MDVDRFLGRLVGEAFERLSRSGDLEGQLQAAWERATQKWPTVVLDPGDFVEYLGDHIAPDAPDTVLSELVVEDLYLAAGCARGDSAALRACETTFRGDIERALGTLDVPQNMHDEVWSRLRSKIFVTSDDAPPAIASFSGRGSLKKWLRVAATRLAISVLRERHRETPLQEVDLPDAAEDLELGHLKRTYQAAFKEAFAAALADLSSEQRTLLRMHLIDKLTIDDLARVHGVHRTSTARWLREAREALANGTRKRLHAALRVRDDELDSIMNVVRSRLDLSLSRLFGGDAPNGNH